MGRPGEGRFFIDGDEDRNMNIVTTRRIAQVFFFLLFIWFCIVATLGQAWWQLRGWPVNWFLQLDPLVGLGVVLSTHSLYAGLIWGAVTLVMTVFLGRFFCGWVCPMGALQQFVGYLGMRRRKLKQRIERNQPHAAQGIKYALLLFLLAAASADLFGWVFSGFARSPMGYAAAVAGLFIALRVMQATRLIRIRTGTLLWMAAVSILGGVWQWRFSQYPLLSAALQTGLLDPIAFIHRAVNLVLLPVVDKPLHVTAAIPRFYAGSALIGLLFLAVILLCLRVPRFYCRFICPLGALLGLLGRWSLWRIGKSEDRCSQCRRCEAECEGACAPGQRIRISECVLCLNCMQHCRHGVMGYRPHPSAAGEVSGPDLNRRQVISTVAAGLVAVPMLRVQGGLAAGWEPRLIRPPGALDEKAFLSRCIKCGQCMRICPTNVIHAADWTYGLERLWTPVLNFRVGTSGCQHNCVACSQICPTAALRPITVDERMGRGAFADGGPLRTGMAFVDHGRCLPWAMDTPCIVCQENCPVSPKAIFTRTEFRPIRNGSVKIRRVDGGRITVDGSDLPPGKLGSGDYFIAREGGDAIPVRSNTADALTVDADPRTSPPLEAGRELRIVVRLQKPYIDPARCIGCGVCEHECPVRGRRAIRVTAENETRHPRHRMILP
jgi:polyferredoxin